MDAWAEGSASNTGARRVEAGSAHSVHTTSLPSWVGDHKIDAKTHLLTHPVAVLRGDAKVSGTVTFEQDSESAPTRITYDLTGNDANAERGFHIHTFGDNTNGCTSAGPHCRSLSRAPLSSRFLSRY